MGPGLARLKASPPPPTAYDREVAAYVATWWTCGDCGNVYDAHVERCPNTNRDRFELNGEIPANKYPNNLRKDTP